MTRLLALTFFATSIALPAQTWTEVGDAGDLPGTAQVPAGNGPLTQIDGTIDDPAQADGPGNDHDLFLIQIDDPATFGATIDAGAFNTQLFLFDTDGFGVTGFGFLGAQLTGQFLPGPGLYYIAVSRFDRDPTAAGSEIWADFPFTERAPDGPGAAGVVDGWNGSQSSFSTGGYSLFLESASFMSTSCAGLELTGDGMPGMTLTFDLTGADPRRFAMLLLGETEGTTVMQFGPLGTLELGLGSGIVPVPMGFTDEGGNASVSFSIPGGFPLSLGLFGQALTSTLDLPPPPGPPVLEFCTSDVEPVHIGN